MSYYARMYLRRGKVSHAVNRADGHVMSVCGLYAWPAWLGTGNQDEYEKAATLPECKRCPSTKGTKT